MNAEHRAIIDAVKNWVEKAVLGLNLCPFAASPYKKQSVHFVISEARDDQACLTDLYYNLLRLDDDDEIETLILICPYHLAEFSQYNEFLGLAEQLLVQGGWQGVYQIASFHPHYCFAGSNPRDRGNWTNRSPFPLLHLIRERSISHAVDHYADIDRVAETNIATLESLDDDEMREIFAERYRDSEDDG